MGVCRTENPATPVTRVIPISGRWKQTNQKWPYIEKEEGVHPKTLIDINSVYI
jgi:hypothetical protein